MCVCVYLYIDRYRYIYIDIDIYTHSFYGEGIFLRPCVHAPLTANLFHHMSCSIKLSVCLLHCFHPKTSFVLDL